MDAGADVGSRDLQQLLAAGGAPEGSSPVATLAVIDELLNREALWHGGHFLQQTVYSCLYMLQPARQAAKAPLTVFRSCCKHLPYVTYRQIVSMDDQPPASACPRRAASNLVLSAYCTALRASVNAVRTIALTAHVCEVRVRMLTSGRAAAPNVLIRVRTSALFASTTCTSKSGGKCTDLCMHGNEPDHAPDVP